MGPLRTRIRAGETNATAAVRSSLDRIAKHDARSHAFVTVDSALALESAARVDQSLRQSCITMPLAGVPIAVKDLCAVDGLGCGAGTRVNIEDLTPLEGSFIRQLKSAGAVVVGKTRTTEFALGGQNLTHPTPLNPQGSGTVLSPGGSSSGSAVAVAAHFTPLAIGTDTGGSVRLPAALCGIAGYKASQRLWDRDGIFPLSPTFDSIGLFARSASDVALATEACADVRVNPHVSLRNVRAGVPRQHFFDQMDAEVREAIENALEQLCNSGLTLVPIDLPEACECDDYFAQLVPWELIQFLGEKRIRNEVDRLDPVAAKRIDRGFEINASDAARLRHRRESIVSTVHNRLQTVDCWLSPTTPWLPRPLTALNSVAAIADWNSVTTRNTRPVNLFDHCAISLPVWAEKGTFACGLQIAACGMRDESLLGIACAMERVWAISRIQQAKTAYTN